MIPPGTPYESEHARLPALQDAERAMEALAGVMRQRMILATALHRATARGKAEGEKVRSGGGGLAWRRHLAASLESVARRLSILSPQFTEAVNDADRAFRVLVARSAAGNLKAQDRTDVDEAFAAVLDAAAVIAAAPRAETSQTASALRGMGWRRARRAWDSIVAEMDSQWQQVQALQGWVNLVQDLQARAAEDR